jgi:hypothetical protein
MTDKIGINTFGTLSSAPDGGIIEHVYNYVIMVLRNFKGEYDENENGITNRLCIELNCKKPPEYSYFFHHQNIEDDKENTSTDFAVFGTFAYAQQNNISETDAPPLIKFEAKRLSSSLPKKREREYLIGEYKNGKRIKNSGGIERLKNGRHGKDVVNACLLGYLQSNSFDHWLQRINAWIREEIENPHDNSLLWDDGDILNLIKSDTGIIVYSSESKRQSGVPIQLRHLWINFTTAAQL